MKVYVNLSYLVCYVEDFFSFIYNDLFFSHIDIYLTIHSIFSAPFPPDCKVARKQTNQLIISSSTSGKQLRAWW